MWWVEYWQLRAGKYMLSKLCTARALCGTGNGIKACFWSSKFPRTQNQASIHFKPTQAVNEPGGGLDAWLYQSTNIPFKQALALYLLCMWFRLLHIGSRWTSSWASNGLILLEQ